MKKNQYEYAVQRQSHQKKMKLFFRNFEDLNQTKKVQGPITKNGQCTEINDIFKSF